MWVERRDFTRIAHDPGGFQRSLERQGLGRPEGDRESPAGTGRTGDHCEENGVRKMPARCTPHQKVFLIST